MNLTRAEISAEATAVRAENRILKSALAQRDSLLIDMQKEGAADCAENKRLREALQLFSNCDSWGKEEGMTCYQKSGIARTALTPDGGKEGE